MKNLARQELKQGTDELISPLFRFDEKGIFYTNAAAIDLLKNLQLTSDSAQIIGTNMQDLATRFGITVDLLHNLARDKKILPQNALIGIVHAGIENYFFQIIGSEVRGENFCYYQVQFLPKTPQEAIKSGLNRVGFENVDILLDILTHLAVEEDPVDTGPHLYRVRVNCKSLASVLENRKTFRETINGQFVHDIARYSVLHDIGKIDVPSEVLKKTGKFTKEERREMESHVERGYIIARDLKHMDTMGLDIIRYHHEWFIGQRSNLEAGIPGGYPYGLKGEEIPLAAQIIAIIDVYDALRAKRHYKPAFSIEQTLGILEPLRGVQFNPLIFDVFIEHLDQFVIYREPEKPTGIVE
jgi:HD-GYP domain-containing protein (c-di-GMP phosphodiesterase class II)